MKTPNHNSVINSKISMFKLMLHMILAKNPESETASKTAFHYSFMGGGNAEFYPRKHTVMSYRAQQRAAKKRRRAR